jgi:hypothetical protein
MVSFRTRGWEIPRLDNLFAMDGRLLEEIRQQWMRGSSKG